MKRNEAILYHLITAKDYVIAVFLSLHQTYPIGELDRSPFVLRCRRLSSVVHLVTVASRTAIGWQDWRKIVSDQNNFLAKRVLLQRSVLPVSIDTADMCIQ